MLGEEAGWRGQGPGQPLSWVRFSGMLVTDPFGPFQEGTELCQEAFAFGPRTKHWVGLGSPLDVPGTAPRRPVC